MGHKINAPYNRQKSWVMSLTTSITMGVVSEESKETIQLIKKSKGD